MDDERRRAKVSSQFKQKVMELPSEDDFDFSANSTADDLRHELEAREKYYLRKIRFYLSEMKAQEDEISGLESRSLDLLVTIKSLKARVSELECKNVFYKNRIKAYEDQQSNS